MKQSAKQKSVVIRPAEAGTSDRPARDADVRLVREDYKPQRKGWKGKDSCSRYDQHYQEKHGYEHDMSGWDTELDFESEESDYDHFHHDAQIKKEKFVNYSSRKHDRRRASADYYPMQHSRHESRLHHHDNCGHHDDRSRSKHRGDYYEDRSRSNYRKEDMDCTGCSKTQKGRRELEVDYTSSDSFSPQRNQKITSGISAKPNSSVRDQHTYLHFSLGQMSGFIGQNLSFHQLSYKQFMAGELTTIVNCENIREMQGRLELLQKLLFGS